MDPETTPDDLFLRLSLVEGFGARHLARLLGRRGLSVPPEVAGQGADRIALLKAVCEALSPEGGARAARVREACDRIGAKVVAIDSDEYPPLLRAVPDAPMVLYRLGDRFPPPASVGVVGSRAPTGAAADFAEALSADLAASGWTVVSGLARGIDAASHRGALRGGGRTVAVLGCGVDVVYPPEAGRLRERIVAEGALVSEHPPGTRPLPQHFPSRNRIISGLSRGVVVVEAACRSGSLITARCALDLGREVMAVPGNPLFPQTEGSNRLLRDGAVLVAGAADVLTALGFRHPGSGDGCAKAAESPCAGAPDREREIIRFLATERHVNELAAGLDIPVGELLPCLLDMELRKLLERRPGDYYKKLSV